jgi:GAF domain-containing protein
MTQDQAQNLLKKLQALDHLTGKTLQKAVVQLLDQEVEYYNWTGFYFMNDEEQQLELGAYVGAFTDHDVIPYGRGICGQVAISGKTFEVPNVREEENYLACSIETKSEIVVPMFNEDVLVGQLDIDSHQLDPFTEEDHDLLNWVVEFVAARLG